MAQNILTKNNARSTILSGITSGSTNLSVQAAHGTRFSAPVAGEITKLTLYDISGNVEICHGITRSGDVWSVIVRGQEGTAARAWNAGDGIAENATAGFLAALSQLDRTETATAKKTFNAGAAINGGAEISGVTQFDNGIGPDYKNNYGLAPSVAAKALTVALIGNNGAAPSATNPAELSFRSVTATTGTYVRRNVVAALSIVSPSGATHGFTAAQNGYLYYYALDNAGAVELVVSGSNQWDEGTLQSTTAISAAADSAGVLYSTVARTNVPIRYLGRVKIQTGAVTGEWDNEDTEVTVQALGFFNVELTGAPKAPTPAVSAVSTEVATAEFVNRALSVGSVPIRGTHLFGVEAQPDNTTRFIGENGIVSGGAQTASVTEADLLWWPVVPIAIRDLYIFCSPTPPAGQTATVTIMKNGVATSLTAQITSAGGVISDTANVVYAGPGDYLSFRSVVGPIGGASLSCSVRFTDQGSGYGISLVPFNYLSSSTLARGNIGLCLSGVPDGTPHDYPVVHDKCYIGRYYEQATSSGTVACYVRVGNLVGTRKASVLQNTAYLMGAVSTEVSGLAPPDIALDQGSFFAFTNSTDGAAVRRRGSWTLLQKTSGKENQIKPLYLTSQFHAQATNKYMGGHGCQGNVAEASKQFPLTPGVLKNFILMNEDAGVDGQTWTANVRINAVQVLQIVLTMVGTALYQKVTNTSSTLSVAAGDRLSVELISSATTGTSDIEFACDHLA